MIVEIDHILLAVGDPDAAAAGLAKVLGLPAAGGGVHAGIGTRNALLSLGGPYLELIGLLDGSPGTRARAAVHPIGAAILAAREGAPVDVPASEAPGEDDATGSSACAYAAVALRSDDLVGDVARLGAAESRLGAAESPLAVDFVRRTRPDGSVIAWPVAFPARLGPNGPAFLIEHAPDEPERAARVRGAGPRLAGLSLWVADPAAVASAWEAALGIRFAASRADRAGAPPDLVATVGPHVIRLGRAADAGGPFVHAGGAIADAAITVTGTARPSPSVTFGGVRFDLQ